MAAAHACPRPAAGAPCRRLPLRLIAALLLAPAIGQAEIFRYQDAEGNWQFADKPPPGLKSDTINEPYARQTGGTEKDLATSLSSRFSPTTPIQRATLAVVAIRHDLGEGSGFFITPTGYILTNRHVVRPKDLAEWKATEQQLAKDAAAIESLRSELADLETQLAPLKGQLTEYEGLRELMSAERRARLDPQYERLSQRYTDRQARIAEARAELRASERRHRASQRDFEWKTVSSSVRRNFTILLKDGSELTARLVHISTKQDLALLKLDGHITPALGVAEGGFIGQGESVFAVGNPIGMTDAATAGIITGLRDGKIVTDAQILPGNSGGPLLDKDGAVVGVNVSRLSGDESPFSAGFGMAIPIQLAIREFSELTDYFSRP